VRHAGSAAKRRSRGRMESRHWGIAVVVVQIGTGTSCPISGEVVPSQYWAICSEWATAPNGKLPQRSNPLDQQIVSRLAGKEIQVFPAGKVFPPGMTLRCVFLRFVRGAVPRFVMSVRILGTSAFHSSIVRTRFRTTNSSLFQSL
jgi:hypothetical protein